MKHSAVALVNDFNLSPDNQLGLQSYYILHWQLQYLIRKLNDDGTLKHNGVIYIPVWKVDLTDLTPDSQMKLSFRQMTDERYGNNYVLIKAA